MNSSYSLRITEKKNGFFHEVLEGADKVIGTRLSKHRYAAAAIIRANAVRTLARAKSNLAARVRENDGYRAVVASGQVPSGYSLKISDYVEFVANGDRLVKGYKAAVLDAEDYVARDLKYPVGVLGFSRTAAGAAKLLRTGTAIDLIAVAVEAPAQA